MKIIVRGMLLWLMLFTAAFAEKITVTSPEKPIIVHSVKQRDFVIALAANPTTGYSWFLQSFDDKLIVPVHQKFIHPENKKLMGAVGLGCPNSPKRISHVFDLADHLSGCCANTSNFPTCGKTSRRSLINEPPQFIEEFCSATLIAITFFASSILNDPQNADNRDAIRSASK